MRVSARLQTTVEEFFAQNGTEKFIDRVCAFLNITRDRLKLISVLPGSAILDFFVLPGKETDKEKKAESTPENTDDNTTQISELSVISEKMQTATTESLGLSDMGSLLGTTVVLNIVSVDGTVRTSQPHLLLVRPVSQTTIGIVIGVSILLLILSIILVVRWIRGRQKIVS